MGISSEKIKAFPYFNVKNIILRGDFKQTLTWFAMSLWMD